MNGFELVRRQPQLILKTGDNITGDLTAQGNAKFVGPLQGNADTATRLQNQRDIQIGNSTKQFDGSGNLNYTLSEIGAVAFHYNDNVTDPNGFRVPGIKADNGEWFHVPSGGILPLRADSCYIGHSTRKFTDMCTVHINTHHVGGHNNNGRWQIVPVVGNDGVMEIGKYIDFHNSKASTADYTFRLQNDGSILLHSGTLSQMSDRELKENIMYLEDIPKKARIKKETFNDFIKNFKFATYNYKGAEETNFGFIAQDIKDSEVGQYILREHTLVEFNPETGEKIKESNHLGFDITGYTTVVAKALQEEIALREKLTTELQETMKKVSELEKEIELLKVQP